MAVTSARSSRFWWAWILAGVLASWLFIISLATVANLPSRAGTSTEAISDGPLQAYMADGTRLHFAAGTPVSVINMVVKKYAQQHPSTPPPGPTAGAQTSEAVRHTLSLDDLREQSRLMFPREAQASPTLAPSTLRRAWNWLSTSWLLLVFFLCASAASAVSCFLVGIIRLIKWAWFDSAS